MILQNRVDRVLRQPILLAKALEAHLLCGPRLCGNTQANQGEGEQQLANP